MNKLTRIEELARKLNQEILDLEVVQEYQKYEKLVLNDEKLKQLEKELKALQKKIVNQKAKQDDGVTKTIQEYQEKKAYYENHPLVVNYLYLQNEVNEILQTINQQMNNALK
ncbi:MAG: YlbF family regulator [Faecalibacillus sp.]|mgnify:FL=1|uniref:YlbF family regulator n=1 Tax=Faecalibacillus sp. TaxID=2678891 RepID=UPI00295F50B1|nr:YlbF family regulator [uncultured Faecalibacillus sp.]MBS7125035.1 YlbF family regulator [Coprobacillus sp.]